VKTLLLSSIALTGLTAAAVAAPPLDASFPPTASRSLAVLVSQDGLPNSGKVTETIPAGSYTYLHVTQDGKEAWLAIPRRDVPVGSEIRYGQGNVMKEFHSKSLDRTFEEVLFLGGVVMAGETLLETPPGHPVVPANPAARENLPNTGKVSEAIAAGNYTYLRVTQDGAETWLAIPKRDVPVGAEVRYADGMLMEDFHSSTLDRTFAKVFFLGGVLLTEN